MDYSALIKLNCIHDKIEKKKKTTKNIALYSSRSTYIVWLTSLSLNWVVSCLSQARKKRKLGLYDKMKCCGRWKGKWEIKQKTYRPVNKEHQHYNSIWLKRQSIKLPGPSWFLFISNEVHGFRLRKQTLAFSFSIWNIRWENLIRQSPNISFQLI